nr:hypothetical protein Iba_chr10bCG8760 [Ipomoea batatas]GME01720.1 hypothetical protein Iba_scaffold584898CG0010 [Ipomoea batatas]GME11799.1 hypothetical protein Iba_scaffold12495CG0010 [Ipomoea batatas]
MVTHRRHQPQLSPFCSARHGEREKEPLLLVALFYSCCCYVKKIGGQRPPLCAREKPRLCCLVPPKPLLLPEGMNVMDEKQREAKEVELAVDHLRQPSLP